MLTPVLYQIPFINATVLPITFLNWYNKIVAVLGRKGAVMATMPALMPSANGKKLRELREGRFLSHRELAKLAGISPTTVLNLETNPDVSAQRRTIRKLAEALGVDPSELVNGGGR